MSQDNELDGLKKRVIQILTASEGMVRQKEFAELGIPGSILRRLVAMERILNPVRGVYMLPSKDLALHSSLAAIAARAGEVVVCLRSAAAFNGMIDRHDARLWLAMRRNTRIPAAPEGYHVVPVRWSGMFPYDHDTVVEDEPRAEFSWLDDELDTYEKTERYYGVEKVRVHGALVRVTTPERTVCDLVRFLGRKTVSNGQAELVSDRDTATAALVDLVKKQNLPALEQMAVRLDCLDDLQPYLDVARRTVFER